MKKWITSGVVSGFFIACLLAYLYGFIQQDKCLDAGGRWLGLVQGCDSGTYESYYVVVSPVSVIVLVAIWFLLSWLVSIIYKQFQNSSTNT
jgi:hypothetical protein